MRVNCISPGWIATDEYLPRAQWCKELQIVNGLKPGQVLAALQGEDVGSIIRA